MVFIFSYYKLEKALEKLRPYARQRKQSATRLRAPFINVGILRLGPEWYRRAAA
jgi:hypothetical protein